MTQSNVRSHDPLAHTDGHTYEKANILMHIQTRQNKRAKVHT